MKWAALRITIVVFLLAVSVTPALAASRTFFLLPFTEFTQDECVKEIDDFEQRWFQSGEAFHQSVTDNFKMDDVLGCAIKTGKIHFNYVPFYIKGLIEFLLALAGLLSVLFIVIGGYNTLIGGLVEDKESGKKTITYAITGLVVSLLAWTIVNIVQVVLTS
jgi:hypothetical protein